MATITAFAQAAWAKLKVSAVDPAFWTGALVGFTVAQIF